MTTRLRSRPLLGRYWSIYSVGEHSVELRSLGRAVRLSGVGVGPLLLRLVPLLDGRQTVGDICGALPESVREEALAFMTRLLDQGLLSDAVHLESADTSAPSELDECLRALAGGESRAKGRSRLAGALVAVYGTDPIARTFDQIVRDCGIATLALGDPATALESSDAPRQIARATLVVAFASGLRDRALGRVNALSLTTGTPWLPVASDGIEAYLGPLVLPGRSACLACLHGRADALGRMPEQLLHAGSRPMLPGTGHLVAGIAAAETVKFLIGIDRGPMIDAIVRIHLRTLEWDRTDVLALPRCAACAGVGGAPAAGKA